MKITVQESISLKRFKFETSGNLQASYSSLHQGHETMQMNPEVLRKVTAMPAII
jgi:hypothetical protein